MDSREKQTMQSLERALDVLEALSSSHGGIGVSELAIKTGLSKTTTHRILQPWQPADMPKNSFRRLRARTAAVHPDESAHQFARASG